MSAFVCSAELYKNTTRTAEHWQNTNDYRKKIRVFDYFLNDQSNKGNHIDRYTFITDFFKFLKEANTITYLYKYNHGEKTAGELAEELSDFMKLFEMTPEPGEIVKSTQFLKNLGCIYYQIEPEYYWPELPEPETTEVKNKLTLYLSLLDDLINEVTHSVVKLHTDYLTATTWG